MRHPARQASLWRYTLCIVCMLAAILLSGAMLHDRAALVAFAEKNQGPSLAHPFGTDWMGRDMLARTLTGLSMSLRIGLLTATFSACISFLLGASAAMGKTADAIVSFGIDLTMSIPHMLLLVLIAFATGKGFWGVTIGMMVTHWMPLARIVRAEILQIKQSIYVQAAQKLGVGRARIVRTHIAPHLFPQCVVGLVLLFPHVMLHEASITFLGFGLTPEQPAIGIILSEGMQYLSAGRWWLAAFPGLALVATIVLFDRLAHALHASMEPNSAHV